ncbi:hypothetical protein SISNIDRAFT_496890 [Sistotremastrum niveocremeum HHB9708]|uniref:Uncharacterized protein n=1 Tax=Sistotremastrum niveocremeum HHB9708 TaxID=1314777 RepID=A0A164RR46_9AGAM|nr:hypothetical protein SISNIDRAFT_496890 [Sistotremastrum niveocremeum HHB9708]
MGDGALHQRYPYLWRARQIPHGVQYDASRCYQFCEEEAGTRDRCWGISRSGGRGKRVLREFPEAENYLQKVPAESERNSNHFGSVADEGEPTCLATGCRLPKFLTPTGRMFASRLCFRTGGLKVSSPRILSIDALSNISISQAIVNVFSTLKLRLKLRWNLVTIFCCPSGVFHHSLPASTTIPTAASQHQPLLPAIFLATAGSISDPHTASYGIRARSTCVDHQQSVEDALKFSVWKFSSSFADANSDSVLPVVKQDGSISGNSASSASPGSVF